jgi:hypothetical protein
MSFPIFPLGVVFLRLGVTEQEERVIPEISGDEPLMAIGCLRHAAPKLPDRHVDVFEIHPMGARRPIHQFAGQHSDLPSFGIPVLDRYGVPRDPGLW